MAEPLSRRILERRPDIHPEHAEKLATMGGWRGLVDRARENIQKQADQPILPQRTQSPEIVAAGQARSLQGVQRQFDAAPSPLQAAAPTLASNVDPAAGKPVSHAGDPPPLAAPPGPGSDTMSPEQAARVAAESRGAPSGPAQPPSLTRAQAKGAAEDALGYSNVSPEEKQKQAVTGEAVKTDIEKGAEVAAREKAATAGLWLGQAQAEDELRANQIKDAEAQHAHEQQIQDDINKTNDAIGNAKVDPERYWHSRSTGQKVLLGLGDLLGGFGGALTGQGNSALKMLNDQIDRDVAAQAADKQSLIEKRAGQQTAYSHFRQMGLDDQAARLSAANAQRQQMVNKIQALANGSQSEQYKQNAQTLIDQLNQKMAGADAERSQLIGATAYRLRVASQQQGAGGPNKTSTHELSKELEHVSDPTVRASLKRLDELRAKNGGTLPGTSAIEQAAFATEKKTGLPATRFLSPEAREVRSLLRSAAEAKAHANGQRGQEAIEFNLETIRGNGSHEDISRGVENLRQTQLARTANARAGHDPNDVAAYDERAEEEDLPEGRLRPATKVNAVK